MKKTSFALICLFLLPWTSRAEDFVLGLIPEQNVFRQVERHKPLADYLSKKLGVEVKLTMLSRYGNIIESFTSGEMDAAFWGSFTGAMAVEKLGVTPIARPVALDGGTSYTGLIFVRKDSKIDSIEGLRGKSFSFVDRATTAGYLYPLALLRSKGFPDPDKYFSSMFFAGSHDSSILSVIKGEAVGGCAKNTIYRALAKEKPELMKDLKILSESEPVPSNTLGVKKGTSPDFIKKLSDVLTGIEKDPDGAKVLEKFGAIRFIPASPEDYKPVFEMARRAKVNLKDYDYVNK